VPVKDSDILDVVHILGLSKNNLTKTGSSPFWDWRGMMGLLLSWIRWERLAAVTRLVSFFQPVRQDSIPMPFSHLKSGQAHTSMLCVFDKSRQRTFSRTSVTVLSTARFLATTVFGGRGRQSLNEVGSTPTGLRLLKTALSTNSAVGSVCLHFYLI
jgi:hypothetical protein